MAITIFRLRKKLEMHLGPGVSHGIVKHPKCLGMPCLKLDSFLLEKDNKLFFAYRSKVLNFCEGYFQEIHDGAKTCHSVEEIHKMHRKKLRNERLERGWKCITNPAKDIEISIQERKKNHESST